MMISRLQRYLYSLRDYPEKIIGLVLLIVIAIAVYGAITISNRSNVPYLERKELKDEQQRQKIIEDDKEQQY